jgi:hypothetical protein
MATRYFFFGTLMDRDVLELVLDRSVDDDAFVPARLGGFRRVRVKKDSFPMLVADPLASVDGMVFHSRDPHEDARILFFEDYDYDLAICRPVTASGPVEAMFYGSETGVEPSDEPWGLETWAPRYKVGFLALSRTYMACFGRMTPEEAEPIWEEGRLKLEAQGLL